MNKKSTSILNGSIISIISSLIIGVLGYCIRIILSGRLELHEYGFIYSALSFFSIFVAIFDLGFGRAGVILMSQSTERDRFNRIFATFTISRLIVVLIGLLLLIPCSGYLADNYFNLHNGHSSLVLLTFWMAATIIMGSSLLTMDAIRAYKVRNIIHTSMTIVTFLIIWIFAGSSLVNVTIAYVAGPVVSAVAGLRYLLKRKRLKLSISVPSYKERLKELVGFGKWIAISTAGFTIMFNMDSLMLVKLTDLNQVGFYNIAIPIFQIPLTVLAFVPKVFIPSLARDAVKHDFSYVRGKMFKLQLVTLLLCVAGLAVGYFVIDDIIVILFNAKFLRAKTAAFILCCGVPFYVMALISLGLLQSIKKEKITAWVIICALAVNFICNYLLIPIYGINGAATATVMSYVFIFITFQMITLKLHTLRSR